MKPLLTNGSFLILTAALLFLLYAFPTNLALRGKYAATKWELGCSSRGLSSPYGGSEFADMAILVAALEFQKQNLKNAIVQGVISLALLLIAIFVIVSRTSSTHDKNRAYVTIEYS